MFKKYIVLIVVIGALIYISANTYIKTRDEYKKSYNFVIERVEFTPTESVVVFDGTEKIGFWNFSIRKGHDIEVGDLLKKDSCSDKLNIYRKQSNGEYKLNVTIELSERFPVKWLCN